MIDHLESRILFSVVSADAGAISSDAGAIISAFEALKSSAGADVKTLTADLKRIKASAGTKGLVTSLKSHETAALSKVEAAGKSIYAKVAPNVMHIVKDVSKLQGNPTSAPLTAALKSDIKKLNAAVAGKMAAFNSDVAAVFNAGNPKLALIAAQTTSDVETQNDVMTAQSHLSDGTAAIEGHSTSFFAEIGQLITDAEA